MLQLTAHRFVSPLGTILLATDGQSLFALDFADNIVRLRKTIQRLHGKCEVIESELPCPWDRELSAYFCGELNALDSIPIAWAGTEFQQKAWQHLRSIPAGQTQSYGEMAKAIGKPNASRAVGRANGSNPVGLVVPCHRVIGADGSLTGYGFGIEHKRWLLRHEGVALA